MLLDESELASLLYSSDSAQIARSNVVTVLVVRTYVVLSRYNTLFHLQPILDPLVRKSILDPTLFLNIYKAASRLNKGYLLVLDSPWQGPSP